MYAGQFLSRMFSASQRPRNVRDFGNCRKFLQHVFAPLLHFQPVLPDSVFSETPELGFRGLLFNLFGLMLLAVKLHPTIRGGVHYRLAGCPSIHSDEDAFCRKGSSEVLKGSLKKNENLGRVGMNNLSALS